MAIDLLGLGGLGLGLGQLATSYYSAKSAEKGQREANATNMQIARDQMAFQERMFKTRHQMEVEDLRAAGLNPILSALNGAGPAPVGASTHVESDKAISSGIMANSAKMLSESMLARAMAKTEMKKQENLDAQTDNLRGTVNFGVFRGPATSVGRAVDNMYNSAKSVVNRVAPRSLPQSVKDKLAKFMMHGPMALAS